MRRASLQARLYSGGLIGLVVLFSIASVVAMAFRHAEISQAENRTLARLPQLPRSLEQWETFPQRFDAYFNDNFGLRTLLLRLNSGFSSVMLGRLPSDKVIIGKDKWLFLAGDQAIDQYRNRAPFSALQIGDAREALSRRARHAATLKSRYLFVVVPDKHNIYPEQMPSYLTRQDRPSQLDEMLAIAKSADVPMLDLKPAIRAGKSDGLVYFKDDTHWTDWGAYLGYRAIMQALPLPELPIVQLDYRQFSVRTEFAGELAGMANLPWVEPTVTIDRSTHRCQIDASSLRQQPDRLFSVARSTCPGAKYKVVYIGDSFTYRVMGYLAQSFGEVKFVVRSGYKPFRLTRPYLDNETPDLIIEELVERHLPSVAESNLGDQ
jgi:hypothetical protein